MGRGAEHVRVLCTLGLPRAYATVEIARAVREVVPAAFTRISHHDARGAMVGSYNENALNELIAFRDFEHLKLDPWSPFARMGPAWKARQNGVFVHGAREYARSAFHAECERPAGVQWVLDIMAAPQRGNPVAGVGLLRGPGDPAFSLDELAAIERLGPWIAHALRTTSAVEQGAPAWRAARSGYAVVNASGRVVEATPTFAWLMCAVEGWRLGDATGRWRGVTDLPAACRGVLDLLDRVDAHAPGVPRTVVETSLGAVALEAKRLLPGGLPPTEAAEAPGALRRLLRADLLEHPLATARRRLAESSASPAQIAVGVRLALGHDKRRIADALGIELSSVEDAKRKLYRRLGVRGSAQLAAHLWGGAHEPGPPSVS